jgi:hypothetical protein
MYWRAVKFHPVSFIKVITNNWYLAQTSLSLHMRAHTHTCAPFPAHFTSPWRWRQQGPPKRCCPTAGLHDVTTQLRPGLELVFKYVMCFLHQQKEKQMNAKNHFHYGEDTNVLLQSCLHYLQSDIIFNCILLDAQPIERVRNKRCLS